VETSERERSQKSNGRVLGVQHGVLQAGGEEAMGDGDGDGSVAWGTGGRVEVAAGWLEIVATGQAASKVQYYCLT